LIQAKQYIDLGLNRNGKAAAGEKNTNPAVIRAPPGIVKNLLASFFSLATRSQKCIKRGIRKACNRKGRWIVKSGQIEEKAANRGVNREQIMRFLAEIRPLRRAFFLPNAIAATLVMAGLLATTTGCNVFGKKDNAAADGQFALQPSDSEEVFRRVREAKSQNSVVVQVVGDSSPVRVLPLPPDQRSIFISDLLKQTGLKDKFGPMRVTVFRPNPQAPMGIPMEVKFITKGGDVRPETDYSLQAGDRIRIAKEERSVLGERFGQFLPIGGG
jgi:hypothetical protein